MTDADLLERSIAERTEYELLESERERCLELARDCDRVRPRAARFFRQRAAEITAEITFAR